MPRVRTQEDFIKAAIAVHGTKYDYSQVHYVKTNEKVQIICPVHGVFEQTPNKHLAGQGCRQCGHERMKTGVDEFVRRAQKVHGSQYDYSKVDYQRSDTKVCIICPVHGEFWQTPHEHVVLGHDCPACGHAKAGKKRCGNKNVGTRDCVKKKRYTTCLERYGAKTWAESDVGRKKLHDIITSDEVASKMQDTCLAKYGAKTWSESDVGHAILREKMSSDEMKEKIRMGYEAAYGVLHYAKTEEGRAKARAHMLSSERKAAIEQAFLTKYGTKNALASPDVQAKIRATVQARYGVSFVGQVPSIVSKAWATRIRNGTTNTSKPEESLYRLLCDRFGNDSVEREHVDEVRYPFHCDFYVRPLDLFIELNAHWSHGGHWFDEDNPLDIQKLVDWEERSKKRGSSQYRNAINVWTERDLLKLETAIRNHLNYLVFWDNNLADALAWLTSL